VLLARDASAQARRIGDRYVLRAINHPVVYTGFALALFYLPLLGLAQFTTHRLMALVWVETDAMFPTLLEGDLLLVDRTAYREVGPEAGEVVVIRQGEGGGSLRLGRVVGVPGDEVEVTDSLPIINGVTLSRAMLQRDSLAVDEVHLAAALEVTGPPGAVTYAEQLEGAQYLTAELPAEIGVQFEPVRLGNDEYFVLHDNRAHFGDSRETGPVGRNQIIGQPIHIAFSTDPEGIRWGRVAKRVQPQPL
jgi:signal peptidase I